MRSRTEELDFAICYGPHRRMETSSVPSQVVTEVRPITLEIPVVLATPFGMPSRESEVERHPDEKAT